MYYYKNNIKLKFSIVTFIFIFFISLLYIYYEKVAIESFLIPRYFYYHNDIFESYKKYAKKRLNITNDIYHLATTKTKKFFKNFDLLDAKLHLNQKSKNKNESLVFSVNNSKIIKYSDTKSYQENNRHWVILLKKYLVHYFDFGKSIFSKTELKESTDSSDIILLTDVIIDYKGFYTNRSSILKTVFKFNNIEQLKNEIESIELISDVTIYIVYIRKSMNIIANTFIIFYFLFCISLLIHYLEIKRIMKITNEKIAKYSIKISKIENFKDIKRVFLANITHELRTPMSSIIGYTEIIIDLINNIKQQKNIEGTLDEIKYYSNNTLVSSNKLLSLIEDFLDLSKAQLNSLSLEYSFLNINDICNYCYKIILSNAIINKVNIYLKLSSENINIYADQKRLKQCILNILSNAIKASAKEGSVMLETKINKQKNIATIRILDTQYGMSKTDIQNALSTFRQISNPNKRRVINGIGFSLTKKLIHMMRGRMLIKSKINHGVIITFEFNLNRESLINETKR